MIDKDELLNNKEFYKPLKMPAQNWGIVLSQFMLIFDKRLRL